MSEAATLALPAAHEITHQAHTASPTDLSIAIRSTRCQSGLVLGAGGTTLLAVGGFLLSHISTTPGLAIQIAILGSLGIVGGLAMLAKSVRDLFGRLVIDDQGIAVRPVFTGFSIPWSELTRWEVKEENGQHPEVPSVRLWIQGTPCPLFVPNGWLTSEARDQIRHALWSHASSKSISAK